VDPASGVATPQSADTAQSLSLVSVNPPPAKPAEPPPGGDPFARLRDVVCPVEVVLGTGTMTLRRVLTIERGGVVRLGQSAGEDLHVTVNGIRLAEAEVVIIDETIAVRVTHLAGPSRERQA
jgi:flagellar motor switch protein FliN